jgi:hypothetical protein
VKLTPTEVRACLYAVAQFRRAAVMGGRRVPPSVAALADRLDRELRFGASPARHQSDSGPGQLEPERTDADQLIGTWQAAKLLGWTVRRVQRHRADLEGRLIGGRLVFRTNVVREYAQGLEDG